MYTRKHSQAKQVTKQQTVRPGEQHGIVSLRLAYLQLSRSSFLYQHTRKKKGFVTCQRAPLHHFFFFLQLKTSKAGNSSEEIFTKTLKIKRRKKRVPVSAMCSVSTLSTAHSQLGLQPNGWVSFVFLTPLTPRLAQTYTL